MKSRFQARKKDCQSLEESVLNLNGQKLEESKSILVVEDEPDVRNLLPGYLSLTVEQYLS